MGELNISLLSTIYRGITKYYNNDITISAYNISRNSIKEKEYTDLGIEGHSIYFLYGENEEGKLKVYVGRSSDTIKNIPLFTRLYGHKISKTESYREQWNSAIAISFDNLSFDEMRNLENYFYRALLDEVKLNTAEPDTKAYKYEDIKQKVDYIKAYVNHILAENVFKEEEKQETRKEIHALKYSEAEMRNQGKRLVDKDFETVTEVRTPLVVVNKTLEDLPEKMYNPYSKFLVLPCTSGEYVKEIFNKLLNSDSYKGTEYESIPDRTIHILQNQLYGITLTDESFAETINSLKTSKFNIIKLSLKHLGKEVGLEYLLKRFDIISRESRKLDGVDSKAYSKEHEKSCKLINKAKEELREMGIEEDTFSELLNNRFGLPKGSLFNVIVGNPPYQHNSASIYNDFIDAAIDMKPEHINMVVKNNWLVSDTLKPTRDNMISYGLKEVTNYPVIGELFNNVSAAVSIFHLEKGYEGDTKFKEIRIK